MWASREKLPPATVRLIILLRYAKVVVEFLSKRLLIACCCFNTFFLCPLYWCPFASPAYEVQLDNVGNFCNSAGLLVEQINGYFAGFEKSVVSTRSASWRLNKSPGALATIFCPIWWDRKGSITSRKARLRQEDAILQVLVKIAHALGDFSELSFKRATFQLLSAFDLLYTSERLEKCIGVH